jgi:hypothetical protein
MLEGIQGGGISTPSNNKQRSKSPGAACPSVIKSLDTSWHQVDIKFNQNYHFINFLLIQILLTF